MKRRQVAVLGAGVTVAVAVFLLWAIRERRDDAIRNPVTHIVVEKSRRLMKLYSGERVLREYKISLGSNPIGQKEREGDRRTPEGDYTISGRNPNSAFHLSLRISYPTASQREAAAALGIDPGGDIMIHGLPNGRSAWGRAHLLEDWTRGCIAVTDPEIREIYAAVEDGTPITIRP